MSHMTPEEFRQWGYRVIDWLADYQARVGEMPVRARVQPGEIRARLPPAAPATGEPFDRILADFERIILPGVTHWQSPNFYGFFPANNSGPSILGELLSAGLGVQGMLWATSPSCTELESHVMDWLVDMMGLPARFKFSSSGGGVIQDSASSAVLCAMLAAREAATRLEFNQKGGDRRLVAYTTAHAHSSVEKAAKIAGIGRDHLRFVAVDETFAMRPEALADQVAADRGQGLLPFFVSGTAGTTSSNAFDPLEQIGQVCRSEGLWFHVDGAMCGSATICPEFRWILNGIETVDSYCFNPHKWMFTNFDCDCFWVADRKALIQALSILPEYLRNQASESGAVTDYRDWQVPLGRRFRALKLWFVIRHYGIEGLQRLIRRHVQLTQDFAKWVMHSGVFRIATPAPLNLICFTHKDGDEATRKVHEKINERGRIFLTHTVLNGRYVLRCCIGQTYTEQEHIEFACRELLAAA